MDEIRRARAEDIPGVMRLLEQVNLIHHNGRPDLFKWPATKYTPGELETIFRDDARPVFVCAEARICLFSSSKTASVVVEPMSMPTKII